MPEPLRALLVGCGGITRAWLAALQKIDGVSIVGMVDLIEDVARARADEFGINDAVVSDDYPGTLARVAPDAVFNCTVPEAHADVAVAALETGCHVLGEKPLADSMDSARRMVATAQQHQRMLAIIQNRRYDPQIRRLRHWIDSGVIGRVTTVECGFYIGAHFGGFRDRMEHVLLLDMAIHTFDAARFIANADPCAVYCHEWNPSGSWYDHDASAVAVFEMTDGIVYTYRGSWCSEGLNTTWESDWRIIGDRGTITWDGAGELHCQVVTKPGGFHSELETIAAPEHDPGLKIGGHEGVIREFIDCVRSGKTPETVASDNIRSLAMVFGAIESADKGVRVAITD